MARRSRCRETVTVLRPDGRLYICTEADAVGVCRFDTNRFPRIPGADNLTINGWASNSRALFASVVGAGSLELYRVDTDSGRRSQLRRIDVSDQAGLTSLGAHTVTPDGRWYA